MNRCPRCKAPLREEAPLGVCPACLLEGGARQSEAPEGTDFGFLTPSDRPDSMGSFDGYEVMRLLGQGATGLVFQGEDSTLRRLVAIKVLHPVLATSAVARQRFLREARAAAAISHEHVVTIHAVGEWNGVPYLVMEYVKGRTLEERLQADGPLRLQEILRIGSQIAGGLAAAHAQGLVHRDIKPGNVLLENGVERVKLTDFGLARSHDEGRLTLTGFVAGTPAFMAPEQVGEGSVDERTDLFSLGAVVYAMSSGRAPYAGRRLSSTLRQVAEASPPPLSDADRSLPDWLTGMIERLMAKDPGQRPASAREVADWFSGRLASTQGGHASPESVRDSCQRRRLAWIALAAVLISGAWLAWPPKPEPAPPAGDAGGPRVPGSTPPLQTPSTPSVAPIAGDLEALVLRLDHENEELVARGSPNRNQLGVVLGQEALQVHCLCFQRKPDTPVPRENHDLTSLAASRRLTPSDDAIYVIVVLTHPGTEHAQIAPVSLLRVLSETNPRTRLLVLRVFIDDIGNALPADRRALGHEVWLVDPGADPAGA